MILRRGLRPGLRARRARAGEGRLRRVRLAIVALLAATLPALAGGLPLPSGQEVTLHQTVVETQADGQDWLILRYLSPLVADGATYEDAIADMDALCAGPGLTRAAETGGIDQIVVALMDRPVPFGTPDPDAVVYIAAYRIEEGRCLWQ